MADFAPPVEDPAARFGPAAEAPAVTPPPVADDTAPIPPPTTNDPFDIFAASVDHQAEQAAPVTAPTPVPGFAPPTDSDSVSHELTLRVPDCQGAYETLKERGAVFLTPPVDWGREIRCFFRDPDGNLLEISQVS